MFSRHYLQGLPGSFSPFLIRLAAQISLSEGSYPWYLPELPTLQHAGSFFPAVVCQPELSFFLVRVIDRLLPPHYTPTRPGTVLRHPWTASPTQEGPTYFPYKAPLPSHPRVSTHWHLQGPGDCPRALGPARPSLGTPALCLERRAGRRAWADCSWRGRGLSPGCRCGTLQLQEPGVTQETEVTLTSHVRGGLPKSRATQGL